RLVGTASFHLSEHPVFVGLGTAGALRPRVDLHETLREQETPVQCAPSFTVVDDSAPHVIDADPRHPRGGAFEIARLLAVELQEGADMLDPLGLGGQTHELVGDAHLDPAIAADHDIVAGLDADNADVLDRRFGAIARAAGHRELYLVRRP